MRTFLIRLLCVFAALIAGQIAFASQQYPDAGPNSQAGESIGSTVVDCLNSSNQAVPVSSGQCANGAPVTPQGQYPWNGGTQATPIQGNGTGSTGAVVGTLAGASGKTTYLCDLDVSAIGGTAAVGPVTVAGLLGGSKVYQMSATAAGVTLSKSFSPCIPASAPNTAITITTTADLTATAVDVNSDGYQF